MAQPKNLYRSNLGSLQSMLTLGTPPPKSSRPRWITQENNNAMYRNVLRQSFGNAAYRKKDGTIVFGLARGVSKTTPFRTAMNAGDIAGSYEQPVDNNILPKPANQVKVGPSILNGWQIAAGGNQTVANGSYYSGNPKFVYDGADYTRFKKLQAINRNYRDPTFGGDQYNASQQAYRRTHG